MRTDAQLAFVPIGGNLSMVGGAGVAIPSNVLDLLGQGVGTAPANIIGTASVFGEDPGVGRYKPEINIALAAAPAFASANAATLNVQFQGAEDQGAAGNYQPGAWQTFVETGYLTLAQLQALQSGANAGPIRLDWPPAFPANFAPRYIRLNFQPLAATNFTAGLVASALVVTVRDDQSNKFAAKNFVVA